MKRRFKAWLVILCLMLSVLTPTLQSVTPAMAAEELILKVHYHRADNTYDGWDVWLWEAGKDGAGYTFTEENGEMVATKSITPGTTSVGFIVRTADWTKDIGEDQFIDIAEMISGTVHIYVESGVKGYTKVYGEDAVTGVKVATARYDGDLSVVVTMTGNPTGELTDAFTINGSEGQIPVTRVSRTGTFDYTLKLTKALRSTGSYTVSYDGNEYKIMMPIIYSTDKFESNYTYTGDDLGATWSKERTSFRVWAPTADAVAVLLYTSGTEGTNDLIETLPMTADVNGTWIAEKSGNLNGVYYTYSVQIGDLVNEACDPYARTTGVNGKRAMVIDLSSTNPDGWDKDTNPNAELTKNDMILYELHIRDLSMDDSSGITNKGKFLGVVETGTTTVSGIPTGLDHIKELGITHLHLLPSYDYGSVDETKLDKAQFNWGYDPVNYNVPEGSYSTDPYNGEVRVSEMKQMVQGLHDNGISVVMDVVYNHVQTASDFCFNKIVPGYFSRVDENGVYSNGSGCGNDTASERSMVRKYIVDSVKYWAEEYHIDGFRFDLVGLLDTETINEVIAEVHQEHPDVIFYGEGWTMTTVLTKEGYKMTTQTNSTLVPDFAFFSDTIRDGLKGSVFSTTSLGYASGAENKENTMIQCFLGLDGGWSTTPSQAVHYASCHDNLTMMDRITVSTPGASVEERIRMNNLAAAFYLTSEGIPFMQAGEEMLRSKPKANGFDENSYASSDRINSIKWNHLDKEEYKMTFNYYKGLIEFRKEHAALRLTNAEDVAANVTVIENLEPNVIAFRINGGVNQEVSDGIFLIFNANNTETKVSLPEGAWDICINGTTAGTDVIASIKNTAVVEPISTMVLVKSSKSVDEVMDGEELSAPKQEITANPTAAPDSNVPTSADTDKQTTNKANVIGIGIVVVLAVLVIAGGGLFYTRRKKTRSGK